MKRRIRTFSGTKDNRVTPVELAHRAISKEAALEGIVLLKNDNFLPLSDKKPVALLGAGAGKTMKGGTGSGDVCERKSVTIYEAMKEAGISITSEDWILDYDKIYDKARLDWKKMILEESGGSRSPKFFDVYASHAFEVPAGASIREKDCLGSDTVIYVISRVAGEGADRKNEEGDYQLTQKELEDIESLSKWNKNIVILINSGGLIEINSLKENPNIRAILYISQPGMEGGYAVTAILFGKANPCGKLTDTWPISYDDVVSAKTFSSCNGNTEEEFYEEGIYVGYRYFDSFDVDTAYCFGYGLSYSRFEIDKNVKVQSENNKVSLLFSVKNIGSFMGKEVVQAYAICPQKSLDKEYRRLVGFAKTKSLKENEMETLSISFSVRDLASFYEEKNAWVLEEGNYYIQLGNSLDDAETCACIKVREDFILENVHEICPLEKELTELMVPDDLAAMKYQKAEEDAAEKNVPVIYLNAKKIDLPVHQISKYEVMAKELVNQLSDEELIYMSVGEVSRGHDVALGAAGIMVPGAAGETSSILEEKYDFPGVSMADGPAGIRILPEYLADEANDNVYTQGFVGAIERGFFAEPLEVSGGLEKYYQYCTAFPIGTMLAQTWNEDLIQKVGETVGKEMENLGISWWLAPGMNIHRNPLCGRNFEYYSEDPLLSGKIAAAMTKGVQKVPGVGTTIKHFACNNQEDNRFGSDSILSERTLREIYLRGFEITVKESQPMAIMSSYNLINGIHAANHKDLLITLLRKEWDFRGMVMTDWTTTSRGSQAWKCPASGNDLIMPGDQKDLENIKDALSDGRLSREELRQSVSRLVNVIYQTVGFEDPKSYLEENL